MSCLRWSILTFLVLVIPAAQKAKIKKPNPAPSNQPLIIKSFTANGSKVELCPFISGSWMNRTTLMTHVSNADPDAFTYTYVVPVGAIEGSGATVVWNLRRQPPGKYEAAVVVKDRKGNEARATVTIDAIDYTSCDPPPPPCPVVSVTCPSLIEEGKPISFIATVKGESLQNVSYEWVTTAGRIVGGQFESKMTLDLSGVPSKPVTATVSLGGVDPSCPGTQASCTIGITQ